MDPITVDTLARTCSVRGTRRQLVTVLAALPLVGVLTGLPADDVTAEPPRDRLQRRTAQRSRKLHNDTSKDNNTNKKNNNKNNQGGGLGDDYPSKCGESVCPSDMPLCCEVYFNGTIGLECFGGTTCPPLSA